MDQHGHNGHSQGPGGGERQGAGAAWHDAATARLRMVRIDRFGHGLPRPVALLLTLLLGSVLLVVSLAVAVIGIGLALIATPFLLSWLAVRRATLGWRSKQAQMGQGRENVIVRRPR